MPKEGMEEEPVVPASLPHQQSSSAMVPPAAAHYDADAQHAGSSGVMAAEMETSLSPCCVPVEEGRHEQHLALNGGSDTALVCEDVRCASQRDSSPASLSATPASLAASQKKRRPPTTPPPSLQLLEGHTTEEEPSLAHRPAVHASLCDTKACGAVDGDSVGADGVLPSSALDGEWWATPPPVAPAQRGNRSTGLPLATPPPALVMETTCVAMHPQQRTVAASLQHSTPPPPLRLATAAAPLPPAATAPAARDHPYQPDCAQQQRQQRAASQQLAQHPSVVPWSIGAVDQLHPVASSAPLTTVAPTPEHHSVVRANHIATTTTGSDVDDDDASHASRPNPYVVAAEAVEREASSPAADTWPTPSSSSPSSQRQRSNLASSSSSSAPSPSSTSDARQLTANNPEEEEGGNEYSASLATTVTTASATSAARATSTTAAKRPAGTCPLSIGHARLRPFPALTCSACAYTVCLDCFVRHTGDRSAAAQQGVLFLDGPTDIHCHVCRLPRGLLTYDAVPPFLWSCETYKPARMALKDGGMYAQGAVQQYYQIRDVREARRRVPADAVSVKWLASQPPPSRAAVRGTTTGATHPPTRPHAVVEGGSFHIALNNPSVSQPFVWCARIRASRRESFADAVDGGDTIVPLCRWSAPPTLPGFDLWTYRVSVPHQYYAWTRGSCVLELRHWEEAAVGDDAAAQGGPAAATAAPKFSISVLHNAFDDARVDADGSHATSGTAMPHAEGTPVEARFALDALIHGRSVGVVGVGSKYAFLEYIAHSAVLRCCGVHRIDALALSSGAHHHHHHSHAEGDRNDRLQHTLTQLETAVMAAQSARLRRLPQRHIDVASALAAADDAIGGATLSRRHSGTAPNDNGGRQEVIDLTTTQKEDDDADHCSVQHDGLDDQRPLRRHPVLCDGVAAAAQVDVQHLTPFRMTTLGPLNTADSPLDALLNASLATQHGACPAPSPPPRLGWDDVAGEHDELGWPRYVEGATAGQLHPKRRDKKRRRDDEDDAQSDVGDIMDPVVGDADVPNRRACPAFADAGLQSDVHPSLSANNRLNSSQEPAAGHWLRFHTQRRQPGCAFPYAVPTALLHQAQRNHTAAVPHGAAQDVGADVGAGGCDVADFDVLVVHNIDALWTSSSELSVRAANGTGATADAMRALCSCLRRLLALQGPQPCVRLLFSFEDVDFLSAAPREFLDCVVPQLVHLQSPMWLLPRMHELEATDWHRAPRATAPLRHAFCAAIGSAGVPGGQGGGGGGGGGAGRRRGLPLSDTVRRVVTSLPVAFRQLLSLTLKKQSEVGEDVYMPVQLLLDYFQSEGAVFVSQGRMRPFVQELTSNRLGLYEPSKHALLILQVPLVAEVLAEVTSTASETAAAAVQA